MSEEKFLRLFLFFIFPFMIPTSFFMCSIINQMIAIFILILIGYVAHKYKLMDADGNRKLSELIINLTCPCLILASAGGNNIPDKSLILPLLIVGFITYMFLIVVAWFLPLIINDLEKRRLYSFMLAFGNVGFIGYPVIASVLGENAIFYASLLNFPNTLFAFSVGAALISGSKKGMGFNYRILGCPAMIASYLSILIVCMDWKLPYVISLPINLLGDITVPSALLIIGSSMAQIPIRQVLGTSMIYIISIFRLLILPFAVFGISKLMEVNATVIQINTLLSAMPVATYGTMFCLQYHKDDKIITQGILISTVLSMITIPIIILFLSIS